MSKIDDLTAFEANMAERTAGMSLATLAEPNAPKTALMGALAWVVSKRDEPNLTHDAFMKRTPYGDLPKILELIDEDEDPAGDLPGGPGLDVEGAAFPEADGLPAPS